MTCRCWQCVPDPEPLLSLEHLESCLARAVAGRPGRAKFLEDFQRQCGEAAADRLAGLVRKEIAARRVAA